MWQNQKKNNRYPMNGADPMRNLRYLLLILAFVSLPVYAGNMTGVEFNAIPGGRVEMVVGAQMARRALMCFNRPPMRGRKSK